MALNGPLCNGVQVIRMQFHNKFVVFPNELLFLVLMLIFSPIRNGCRPFVELYLGEERLLSTSQEYEKMT